MRACVIGAGNVATHLAHAIAPHVEIVSVFSRNLQNAKSLAYSLADIQQSESLTTDSVASELSISTPQPIDNLDDLPTDADLYLISVPDDSISAIIDATSAIRSGIWVHTSGSMPIDVFAGKKERYGVFYPLQTFSKAKPVEMSEVPMLIEASDEAVGRVLTEIAESFSHDVKAVDSEGRRRLHVAAVFACNFVNYMWSIADNLLRETGLDIRVLQPLLRETLHKIESLPPREAQTGPARRGDIQTIEKHLAMLSPSQAEIYKLLSDKILTDYNSKP